MDEAVTTEQPAPGKPEAKKQQPPKPGKPKAAAKKAKKRKKRPPTKTDRDIINSKQEQFHGTVQVERGDESYNRNLGIGFWESVPYMLTHFSLHTPYTQQVFKRVKGSFAINAYLAEVYPSVASWSHAEEILRCVQTLVDHQYEKALVEFDELDKQTRISLEAVGLGPGDMPNYINPQNITYAITSPRVRHFIQLLERMDEIIQRLDALWMSGLGADQKHARHESLRLRAIVHRYTGSIFRQSDRIRRVIKHKTSPKALLKELQDDIDQNIGRGLKSTDAEGDNMLIEGEEEVQGPLVGEQPEPGNEKVAV